MSNIVQAVTQTNRNPNIYKGRINGRLRKALSCLSPDEARQARRRLRIALSKESFWLFCRAIAPDFYKDSRPHLKRICDTLQALYEDRIWKEGYEVEDKYGKTITRPKPDAEWQIANNKSDIPEGAYICDDMKMHIPPRHGKSRTLIYFECWCYGQWLQNSVITVSYNEDVASEFSRFVRDEIMKTRTDDKSIVMSDIFPDVRIKDDDASVGKWSLIGSHFSYLGTGINGGTTSKGGTIQVVDDPIKDASIALNEAELDKQWSWFNDTFLSRTDAPQGRRKLIVNHTRWSSNDIAGRIERMIDPLTGTMMNDMWYTLTMKVMDETTGEMLCEDILSRASFYKITANMSETIMRANYFQEPLDVKGRLYDNIKEYVNLPDNVVRIRAECDPADTGKDNLCYIAYAETSDHFAYVLDVIYDDRKVEYTIPLMAKSIIENNVQRLIGESNSGGRLIFNNLQQYLEKEMKYYKCFIDSKPTSANKETRIVSMSDTVQKRIFMPPNWRKRFDKFSVDVYKYISGGKNAHDDGPDCLTRIAERLVENGATGGPIPKGVVPCAQVASNGVVHYGSGFQKPVVRVARVIRR